MIIQTTKSQSTRKRKSFGYVYKYIYIFFLYRGTYAPSQTESADSRSCRLSIKFLSSYFPPPSYRSVSLSTPELRTRPIFRSVAANVKLEFFFFLIERGLGAMASGIRGGISRVSKFCTMKNGGEENETRTIAPEAARYFTAAGQSGVLSTAATKSDKGRRT